MSNDKPESDDGSAASHCSQPPRTLLSITNADVRSWLVATWTAVILAILHVASCGLMFYAMDLWDNVWAWRILLVVTVFLFRFQVSLIRQRVQ